MKTRITINADLPGAAQPFLLQAAIASLIQEQGGTVERYRTELLDVRHAADEHDIAAESERV